MHQSMSGDVEYEFRICASYDQLSICFASNEIGVLIGDAIFGNRKRVGNNQNEYYCIENWSCSGMIVILEIR